MRASPPPQEKGASAQPTGGRSCARSTLISRTVVVAAGAFELLPHFLARFDDRDLSLGSWRAQPVRAT
jgi:hypothetical protein